jgi:hypothetical protein
MSVYKAMLITLMAAYGKASVRYKEGTQVRGCREEVGVSFTVVNVKVKMRKKMKINLRFLGTKYKIKP